MTNLWFKQNFMSWLDYKVETLVKVISPRLRSQCTYAENLCLALSSYCHI